MSIESNIGAGKMKLFFKKIEQSSEDKVTIKIEYKPVKEFQNIYGNDLKNPLEHFYENPTDNTFIFQSYELHVYQQRMETLETVQHLCKVIVTDFGLDACQIFTTVNKDQYTKFSFLYLTEKYL